MSPGARAGPRQPSAAAPASNPSRAGSVAIIGTKKRAKASDASSDNTTAAPRSEKSWPAMPSMKTIGKNTATVVSVEATTAPPTSRVPRTAASRTPSPSSRHRTMDSSTTIALSTSIPMPRASPPSDMMFTLTPSHRRGANVAMTDSGIARPITKVG